MLNPFKANFFAYNLTRVLPWLQQTTSQQPLTLSQWTTHRWKGLFIAQQIAKKRRKRVSFTTGTWHNAGKVVSRGVEGRNQLLFGCGAATKLVLSWIDPRLLLALRWKHYEFPRQLTAPEFSAAAVAISIDRGQRADFEIRTLATPWFPNRFQKESHPRLTQNKTFQQYLDCKNPLRNNDVVPLLDAHVPGTNISVRSPWKG